LPIYQLKGDHLAMARSFLGPATAKNAMLITLLEHGTDHFWGDFDANGRLKALAANEHNRMQYPKLARLPIRPIWPA
jgi:hypothetical protein